MRRTALGAALLTLLSSGAYVFVYLYRWEWNRALICGVIFIAAEVALATVAVLDRLRGLGHRLDKFEGDRAALHRIQETAPPPRPHFAWLDPGSTNVFVPILLGAGVVLSGLAWLLERLARLTARPVLEHGLAGRLQALELPEGGLLGAPDQFPWFGPGVER